MHVHVHTCACISMYMCGDMCVLVYTCACISMYMCVLICTCVYWYVHVRIGMYDYPCVYFLGGSMFHKIWFYVYGRVSKSTK